MTERFRVDVVTLFPDMFTSWLAYGVVARSIERGHVSVNLTNLRQFGLGRHRQVDDTPFGGGAGMVLRPEPLFAAVDSINDAREGPIILLSPRGRRFDHRLAVELAGGERLTLLAGHYEGVDERVSDYLASDQVSIGDYVVSGGELPAMVVIDAVIRLRPGVIDEESTKEESFVSARLEYPQYTRPAAFRGWPVPSVLTSGDHARVTEWRRLQADELTRRRRPDLLETESS